MSMVGLVICFAVVVIGSIMVKDVETGAYSIAAENLKSLFDLTSIVVVIFGTFAALAVMFPLEFITRIPKHMMIVFMPKVYQPDFYITTLVECARKARMSGLLALEEDVNNLNDPFLCNSLQMIVDSVDPEKVQSQMQSWLSNIDDRHVAERQLYEKGAALGPAFGMIGTLIGLINMLKDLEDVATVGPNMAVALITTFYGSVLANVFFAPIANKLKMRHEEEYLCMSIVVEGIQAIQAGENPKLIQDRLLNLLPEYKLKKMRAKLGDGGGGGE